MAGASGQTPILASASTPGAPANSNALPLAPAPAAATQAAASSAAGAAPAAAPAPIAAVSSDDATRPFAAALGGFAFLFIAMILLRGRVPKEV